MKGNRIGLCDIESDRDGGWRGGSVEGDRGWSLSQIVIVVGERHIDSDIHVIEGDGAWILSQIVVVVGDRHVDSDIRPTTEDEV